MIATVRQPAAPPPKAVTAPRVMDWMSRLVAKANHEAIRTHLDLLGTILGDKSSQGRVSDVVGSVEHSIQQRVCNQEPCILCKLTEVRRNCKNSHQRDGTADIAIQHPRTSLAHLGVGLIDQRAKENVRHTIQQFGKRNQSADDAGVQTNRVGQVDHNKGRKERIHNIACNVA